MCFDNERDLTKLEAYVSTKPRYNDIRMQAYADAALDELLIDVMGEITKPPYYISGEEEIPIRDIVDWFSEKMRYFLEISNPDQRLMFFVALREAKRLRLLFL